MKFGFSHIVVNEVYLTDEDKNDAYANARYAAVSYIPPLSLVMLLSPRRQSKFVSFHGKQAFIIHLLMLVGVIFSGFTLWIIEVTACVLAFAGFFYAATGRYFAIPGIIHILSFNVVKDSPAVKKVKSARAEEIKEKKG